MVLVAKSRRSPFGICSSLSSFFNFFLYAAITAIAAYLFDKLATADPTVSSLLSPIAVYTAVIFSLLSGAVGLATSLMGIIHGASFTESARFGSMASNMVTLPLAWLAAGFSIRCIRSKLGRGSAPNARALTALFSLDIILMLFSLLYILQLLCFKHSPRDGVVVDSRRNDHHVVRDTAVVGGAGAAAHHHHNKDVEAGRTGYTTNTGYAPNSTVPATGVNSGVTTGTHTPGFGPTHSTAPVTTGESAYVGQHATMR